MHFFYFSSVLRCTQPMWGWWVSGSMCGSQVPTTKQRSSWKTTWKCRRTSFCGPYAPLRSIIFKTQCSKIYTHSCWIRLDSSRKPQVCHIFAFYHSHLKAHSISNQILQIKCPKIIKITPIHHCKNLRASPQACRCCTGSACRSSILILITIRKSCTSGTDTDRSCTGKQCNGT